MDRIFLYKIFLSIVLISPFLGFFTRSGILAYTPVILIFIIVVLFELVKPSKLRESEFLTLFLFLPYSLLALFYYLNNPLDGRVLTTNFLAIILSPVYIHILLVLNRFKATRFFVLKSLFYFFIAQLILCLGQLSTYTFGIGLPVSEDYVDSNMITGSFNNANDLAAIVLLACCFFSTDEVNFNKSTRVVFWIILFMLLLSTGSRSALILSLLVFLVTRKINYNFILISIFISFLSVFMISILSANIENDSLNRMVLRVESIFDMFENGLLSDNSMSIRVNSYISFFENFSELGLGSGKLQDYFIFNKTGGVNSWLMYQNPHSLPIEIAYWIGWLGFFSFIIPVLYYIFFYTKNKIVSGAIFLSMFISSSVLGSYIYFLFFFIPFFLSANSKELIRN